MAERNSGSSFELSLGVLDSEVYPLLRISSIEIEEVVLRERCLRGLHKVSVVDFGVGLHELGDVAEEVIICLQRSKSRIILQGGVIVVRQYLDSFRVHDDHVHDYF